MAKHIVKANEPPKCDQCGAAIKGAHFLLVHSNGSRLPTALCKMQCVAAFATANA